MRYYICGQVGSGTEDDPYRPEIADEPGVTAFGGGVDASGSRYICAVRSADVAAVDAVYDFIDVDADGAVTLSG